MEGKGAVVEACNSSAAEMMANLTSVELADDHVAAIDAVGRCVSPDGTVSVVSSADVYEFDHDGYITTITLYAVELDV